MPVRTQPHEEPTLNLTPMIDVILVLIIFFMVATKFAEEERSVELQVPSISNRNAAMTAPEPKVVNVHRDGSISLGAQSVTIGEQTLEILSWDHVVDAVDLVLRSWHLGVREPGAKDAASKDPDAAPSQANGADAPRPAVPPFARSQRISLEALRRSVAESRLTREEFSALGRQARHCRSRRR